MTNPAMVDPLAGLIADAHMIPAEFQPRPPREPTAGAPAADEPAPAAEPSATQAERNR